MKTDIDELNWYKIGFENASAGMVILLMEDFISRYSDLLQITELIKKNQTKFYNGIFEAELLAHKIVKVNGYIERLIAHQSKNDADDAYKRTIINRSIKKVVEDTTKIKNLMIDSIEKIVEYESRENV